MAPLLRELGVAAQTFGDIGQGLTGAAALGIRGTDLGAEPAVRIAAHAGVQPRFAEAEAVRRDGGLGGDG